MRKQPVFITRKFPPSIGGMETLAASVWRSMLTRYPEAHKLSYGGANIGLLWWLPLCLVRVFWLCLTRRIEYALCGDALMNAACAPVLRLFGVPRSTMVMGLDITFDNALYRALAHPPLRSARRVIAISAATREAAIADAGVDPARIEVVRLGVPDPGIDSDALAAAREHLRKDLGLGRQDVMVVALGRLVRRKGVRWFVENVLPKLPETVHFVVGGSGPESDAIATAADSAGVKTRVHLLGSVTDEIRDRLMAGADVFVQPNIAVPGDMEGFGLVAVEAALRDTTVLAADLEGLRDAVQDGETGILLPSGDAEAWARTLTDLIARPADLERQGQRLGARARETYSERAMGAALVQILTS
jgi:phosphatidylinositol alpha-1,6-mannosyltransferase